MSDNKGLSDQELLKLCQSGGPITNEDIGGKTQSGSDITYLNESGMHRAAKYYGINIMLEEKRRKERSRMVKVFISQPMRDKTDEEIKKERERAIEEVKKKFNDDVKIIDSFFEGAPHDAKPLWFLGESFKKLADADVAYFCKGFKQYRGCMMEYRAAKFYGINIMLEEDHYVDMDFGEALNLCKNGNKIARSGWNGKNMFVVYQKGYPEGIPCNLQTAEAWGMNEGDNFICNPYLQIKTTDGSHSMWAPSTGDCLANDWYVVY